MKRASLFILGCICLIVCVLQFALLFTWKRLGVTYETWRTVEPTGFHANRGVIWNAQGLLIFLENEQHPVPPSGGTWFPREWSSLDSAGSPPQYTVSNRREVTSQSLLVGRYIYSARDGPDWQGQYRLVVVHPYFVLQLLSLIGVLAWFRAFKGIRRRVPADASSSDQPTNP
jgi:hypothetical protein